jgi:uncharacterized protein (DUF2235 family)
MSVAAFAYTLRSLNARRDVVGDDNLLDQIAEAEKYLESAFSRGDKVEATDITRDGFGRGPGTVSTITGTVAHVGWIERDEPHALVIFDGSNDSKMFPVTALTRK